ncbi:tetratricopeptide repeat protein [Leptolyngbya sp. CCNP1308]|uniref:tetratricopeptide repeat protein n=1 Tax=Leptolyngbya sp. CCNP1308 TaxID=3110255 RepID=UPI002B1FA616|nr:tetratricopeptide repeat protein [Leptolyngbya sp. CCNP1308]MEA5451820.1 tetratricopeptide repeat protein [Leptolyngbya sp. CCNP1308]
MTDNTAQRLALWQRLVSLPPPQFEQVLFSLKPPSGNVPPFPAAQSDRVSALLAWAESIGCGLDRVEATYTLVIDPKAANRPPAPVFNLPFPRNPFFTGREDQLQAIHTALTSRGRAALSGLGGIGKTQTALEYAYRHQAEYEHVFWVRAEQETELITGYVALAKALQLPGHQQEDQQAIVALMKQWLATHDRWLLVLDNADDLRQMRTYLPATNGHILLTTRAQALGDLAHKVEVTRMDADEGALLLLRRAKAIVDDADLATASDHDQALAHALNTEMDGLPLALDQAGAYIEELVLSLEEYLDLFRTEKAELLKERGQLNSDHPSVTVTFTLAFEKVAAASATAAELVRACAFLAPDAIPEEIFREGIAAFEAPLSTLAESKLALSKAIGEATRFSLISRNPQAKTLTIHRLVQEVLRSAMDEYSQRQWAEQVVEAVTTVFPKAQFENWVQCDRLIVHAQATTNLISVYGLASETAALLLNRTGYYYASQGRYGDAEPLYLETLAMRKQIWGETHPDVAISLNNLAALYSSQGRYREVEPLYLEALAMSKQLLSEAHPAVATSLNNLAVLYASQGRYGDAEPLYLKALAMRKQIWGETHPEVATSLNNLAMLYASQGRYGDAEPLYLEALAMRKQLLSEAHPDVAQNLNNLAMLYKSQGRYGEAEPLYLEALAMYKQLLGEAHPEVATSLNNLAVLYDSQGGYGEAEPLYLEALAMRKQIWGETHPEVATSLNNLAVLYKSQGRYGEAEPLYLEALAMYKQLLGEVHPNVANSLNNLAVLYASQGRYGEAEPLYLETLAMRKQLLSEAHPEVAQSLNNLATLYSSQGRYGEAEPLYLEALAMYKQLLGEAHPDVATSLFSLGALRYNQGRYCEAQALLLQAHPIYLAQLGLNHPNTQALQSWIDDTQAALDSEPH